MRKDDELQTGRGSIQKFAQPLPDAEVNDGQAEAHGL
jgi:hypothetical protein